MSSTSSAQALNSFEKSSLATLIWSVCDEEQEVQNLIQTSPGSGVQGDNRLRRGLKFRTEPVSQLARSHFLVIRGTYYYR